MPVWTTRRQLRLAFAATAAAACLGFWLVMPTFTTDFLGMILVGALSVLGSGATIIALWAVLRDEDTPEIVILALLFSGGVAMLLAIVVPEPAAFPLGLAVFAAGAASMGGPPRETAPSAKKRRASE